MGCFPYECASCGGGYKRCGQGHPCEDGCEGGTCVDTNNHTPCHGGQFCWEDMAVVEIDDKQPYYKHTAALKPGAVVRGEYDSYGRVFNRDNKKDRNIYIPNEFADYVEGWYSRKSDAKTLGKVVMCSRIWCASCYVEETAPAPPAPPAPMPSVVVVKKPAEDDSKSATMEDVSSKDKSVLGKRKERENDTTEADGAPPSSKVGRTGHLLTSV